MTDHLQPGLPQDPQHLDPDTLGAFAEGALRPHERDAALAHLAVCSYCRELAPWSLPPFQDLQPGLVVSPRRGWRWLWAGAVACSGVGLAAVVLLHRSTPPQAPTPAPFAVATVEAPPAPALPGAEQTLQRQAANPKSIDKMQGKPALPPAAAAPAVDTAKAGAMASAVNGSVQTLPENARNAAGSPARKSAPLGQVSAAQPAIVLPSPLAPSPLAPPPAPRPVPSMRAAQAPLALAQNGQADTIDAVRSAGLTRFVEPSGLPSHLTTASRFAQGEHVVAADSAGNVFFSKDAGMHWGPVKAVWAGRAVALSAAYEPLAAGPAVTALVLPLRDDARAGSALIEGSVRDPSGAVIPGASVNVSGPGTMLRVLSDRAGKYEVHGLAAGSYRLRMDTPGFTTLEITVVVTAGQHLSTDVILRVDNVSETVNVSQQGAANLPVKAPAVFALVTSRGERWVSSDGTKWTREK